MLFQSRLRPPILFLLPVLANFLLSTDGGSGLDYFGSTTRFLFLGQERVA
jgi:hypothetical protein